MHHELFDLLELGGFAVVVAGAGPGVVAVDQASDGVGYVSHGQDPVQILCVCACIYVCMYVCMFMCVLCCVCM